MQKRVFNIAAGTAFLPTLARALAEGRLIDGFRPIDDPACLADATVYLPTRRAARAFAAILPAAMGRDATILPGIRTLGDRDDETGEFDPGESDEPLPHAPGETQRRLHLAPLVRTMKRLLAQEQAALLGAGGGDAAICTAAEAFGLADELARLFDQIETEEVGWAALAAIGGEAAEAGDWSKWWALSSRFLEILSEQWPRHLAAQGMADPSELRRLLIDRRTARYRDEGSAGPVIAAGSTGSIPATARLLDAVAGLPNGAVILPGLDRNLPPELMRALGEPDNAAAGATHPQAVLARLLASMQIAPDAVAELGAPDAAGAARNRMISLALLPADATAVWSGACAATDGLTLIEARSEQEEALALAIAMRETLESPGRTAALVTPNRSLARRVAAELRRFDLTVDDSGGRQLTSKPAFRFVELLAMACLAQAGPVTLAALIKHPHLTEGGGAGRARLARLFELVLLRDAIAMPPAGGFERAVETARVKLAGATHKPRPVARMTRDDWRELADFARSIDRGCAALVQLAANGGSVAIGRLAAVLLDCARRLAGTESEGTLRGGEAGQAVDALLSEMAASEVPAFRIRPAELPALLRAAAGTVMMRDPWQTHPRLAIWGPLEARLQAVDRVLLGSLNEGSWPAETHNDPFLNRPMKSVIGLTPPERRIGQGAHDFQQLSGHREVIYSRSQRMGSAPTVASRWLQRLAIVAGPTGAGAMRHRGERFLAMARQIDRTAKQRPRAVRPQPRPPVALRPKSLSITEVETWIHDPYQIHARHILSLEPLPALVRAADARMRGQIYHAILERFVSEIDPALPPPERLEAIADAVLSEYGVPDHTLASWRPRFLGIARLYLDWEQERLASVQKRHLEIRGRLAAGENGFVLRGRADRIDRMRDGSLAVLDYKTGSAPSAKKARSDSPQLALEAYMAQAGAFPGIDPAPISDMAYVRLRPGEKLKIDRICEERDAETATELITRIWRQFEELVAGFENPDHAYVSRRAAFKDSDLRSDYDHLARVREWMIAEDGEDE